MRFARIIALSSLAFAALDSSRAAEVKILSTRAVMTILETVGPEFERTTGHKLHVSSDIAINHVRRVMAGEFLKSPAVLPVIRAQGMEPG